MSNNTYAKHSLLFHIVSGVCLFSILFLGSWTLYGPINLRNFAAICVFIIALFTPPLFPASNSVTKVYFIWLAVYVIVNLVSGNASQSTFIRGLLTYHLLSIFTIISIPHIVADDRSFKVIALWITVFYIINSLITILQFHNSSLAWSISQAISPMSEAGEELLETLNEGGEGYVGKSIIPGITGFVVSNGYYLTCFLPFVTKGLGDHNTKNRVFSFFILLLGIYAIFCTQQRMAFYLSLLYVLYLVIFQTSGVTKLGFFIVLLVSFVFSIGSSFNMDQYGRLFSLEDDIRSQTWTNLQVFVSDPMNLLFGMHDGGTGSESVLIIETMSHNSILDALRRGGIISLIIMLVLYVRMLLQCILISMKKVYSSTTKSLAMSCSLFLVYSLTHSIGLQSGSVECWLLYMLMLSSIALETIRHGMPSI